MRTEASLGAELVLQLCYQLRGGKPQLYSGSYLQSMSVSSKTAWHKDLECQHGKKQRGEEMLA